MIGRLRYDKVEYPAIRKTKATKDFSYGFYCFLTEENTRKLPNPFSTAIVNVYQIKNKNTLRIKQFDDYSTEWLDFVMSCRNGATHTYDVVIGPRADDTIYDYMEAYKEGQLNEERFFEEMKEKNPIRQISFHTLQALECIEFVECYEV